MLSRLANYEHFFCRVLKVQHNYMLPKDTNPLSALLLSHSSTNLSATNSKGSWFSFAVDFPRPSLMAFFLKVQQQQTTSLPKQTLLQLKEILTQYQGYGWPNYWRKYDLQVHTCKVLDFVIELEWLTWTKIVPSKSWVFLCSSYWSINLFMSPEQSQNSDLLLWDWKWSNLKD